MKKKRDYNKIIKNLYKLNKRKYYKLKKLGTVKYNKTYEIFQLIIKKKSKNPNILISAGTHGWEPAGVYALQEFLEKYINLYLDSFNFYIYPCNNPSGFEYDILTNLNKKDLNREFRKKKPEKEVALIKKSIKNGPKHYLFTVDLHEVNPKEEGEGFTKKDNPKKFYLYEDCANKDLRIGNKIINKIKKDIPICTWKKIYGDINKKGVVLYPEGNLNPIYKKAVTFDQFLFPKYTKQAITFETPVIWNINRRIKTHIKALQILFYFK